MSEEKKTPSIFGTQMARFKIDLSNREISDLSDDRSLGEIRSLVISNNQFRSFDFVDKTPYLIELDASKNHLSEGIAKIGQMLYLSKLYLSSNLFERITGFPLINSLTVLDLSNNHLTSASELPSLPNLVQLKLSHNNIAELQIDSLTSLQVLDISFNVIKYLSLPKLPSLRQLDANNNAIKEIQEFQEDDLPCMWSLDLRSNSIETSNTLSALSKLPMLFDLKINSNPIVDPENLYIQDAIVVLPNISKLDGEIVTAKMKVKAQLKESKDE